MTAALYKRQTKAVERDNAAAQARMTAVANQAFRCSMDAQHTARRGWTETGGSPYLSSATGSATTALNLIPEWFDGMTCAWAALASLHSQAIDWEIPDARSAIRTVRSFAGEGLERERFAEHVAVSQRSGISFAQAKAMLESLNRRAYALLHWRGRVICACT